MPVFLFLFNYYYYYYYYYFPLCHLSTHAGSISSHVGVPRMQVERRVLFLELHDSRPTCGTKDGGCTLKEKVVLGLCQMDVACSV